jgi:hypothetical protein
MNNNRKNRNDIKYPNDVECYNDDVFELWTTYLFLSVVSVSNIEKDIKEKGMHEFCFAVCLRRFGLKKKKGSCMSILDINL